MAIASTPTLLSLDRYAQLMQINPAHFNRAHAPDLSPPVFPLDNKCQDVWFKYDWQKSDSVSWESLALAIHDAEEDFKRWLGFSPAPAWEMDVLDYPRFYRPDLIRLDGLDARAYNVGVKARQGKIIQAGRRQTALLPFLAVDYSDDDLDGLSQTATVTATASTTDACEIKVYFAGHSAAPEWEIRPARTKAISGGVFTATFYSWQLIDPDLWEAFPTTAGASAINISTTTNFVTTVEVYREYTDDTQASAVLYWEPTCESLICLCGGTGCVACSFTSQDGCIHVRDVENGVVVPQAANYNASTGQWDSVCFTECRDPDQVRIYYYAGDQDMRYLRGVTCEPLSDFWARAIAWLATARLERPFCACGNLVALAEDLRTDLAFTGTDTAFQVDLSELGNPFGTRKGEIMAWRRVNQIADRVMGVALV